MFPCVFVRTTVFSNPLQMPQTSVALEPTQPQELPVEVFHHCLTFSLPKEVVVLSSTSRRTERIVCDNDLWQQLIDRDFSTRLLPPEMEDRSRKIVYQTLKTGKQVERSFNERTKLQKGLIVIGCVVLSPVLLIYLSPKILRGIYRSCFLPVGATWRDVADQVAPAPGSKYATGTWAATASRAKLIALERIAP